MVTAITGVVNDVPVPRDTPPAGDAYQSIIPADGVAPRVTVPAPQIESGDVDMTVTIALTVATTAVLVNVVHPLSVAST